MPAIADFRDRVSQMLVDVAGAIYADGLIDESLRHALGEYSAVCPQALETVVNVLADGREIELSGLAGLLEVTEVYWPFDSAATEETWPPNRVRGWRVFWDITDPVLHFIQWDGEQPQAGDEARIWYTAKHTIEGLDAEAVTSVSIAHESLIVLGAAGYTALSRATELIETAGIDLYQVGLLGTMGTKYVREFQSKLEALRKVEARRGPAWGQGWALDKWDSGHS